MNADTDGLCLENNPDISGIGVRLSFYLQTFFLVVLVDRSEQSASGASPWTYIASALGLTISAIAQARYNELSLFQAVQISNLVWLADFAIFFALASFARQRKAAKRRGKKLPTVSPFEANFYVEIVGMVQILLSMSLTIYMWSTASTFGSQPDCNHTIRYVLFKPIPALGQGRKGALAASSLLMIAYVIITGHEQWASWQSKQKKKCRSPPTTQEIPIHHAPSSSTSSTRDVSLLSAPQDEGVVARTRARSGSASSTTTVVIISPAVSDPEGQQTTVVTKDKDGKPRPVKRNWHAFTGMDPILAGIMLFLVMILSYFIISTELLIKINPASDKKAASEWGFGQVLAMVVVAPSVLSLISALKTNGLGPVHKHSKSKKKKSRKQRRDAKRHRQAQQTQLTNGS